MLLEFGNKKLNSIFGMTDDLKKEGKNFSVNSGIIRILWNRNTKPVRFYIDDIAVDFKPNQIATTTFQHHITFDKASLPLTTFVFNREFYCIYDHDSEVSCNGILFFGTQDPPVITIPKDQFEKFENLYGIFLDEFNTPDKIQGDMLQMLLKRLIIICTRLAKEQLILKITDNSKIDIIRQFNFLVDMHFKTKRQVSDYAELLNKSPKTLSNLFLLYNQKTPHQIIHERVALEARRLLLFSEKNSKQIAYDLGFEEPAHFSKFFKKIVGLTPTEYKEKNFFN